MPGIAGVISQKPAPECRSVVDSMIAAMTCEPFYSSGGYASEIQGIYAGWVALDDSPNAQQVFHNEEGSIALLFSGECMAAPSVKNALRVKQHAFDDSGAEWLVHFYEEEGAEFFGKLNGVFSGILIDLKAGRAFLFNDRYGLERIYFHESKNSFYFASEAKALLAVIPEVRSFDSEGIIQYLTYGCTLNWKTLFNGVDLMPGGSLWTFENGHCSKKFYFDRASWEEQETLSAEEFDEAFQETFTRILPGHFTADSRIGISLTAGQDTRMIMSCLPKDIEPPVCYTYAEAENETLDARIASSVAKACGLEHQHIRLMPDFFDQFGEIADQTVVATDGTFGVLGSHEIYLSRNAREYSTVRMTGNYGSEILRDVSTFKPFGLASRVRHADLEPAVLACSRTTVRSHEHPVGFAVFKEIPWELFGSLCACRSQLTCRTPYLDNDLVALAFRAPDQIRCSGKASLRFVFDNSKTLGSIPTDRGELFGAAGPQHMMRLLFEAVTFKLDYYYDSGLPYPLARLNPVFNLFSGRGKVFGRHRFLHYRRWFQTDLSGYIRSVLTDSSVCQSPFWNQKTLETLADEHIAGRKNYVREIDAVLTLAAIERLLFHPS